jgi:hypothetical protein
MSMPWPMRSVLAGAAGTATMTLAYLAEHRLRATRRGPLDYDDSLVPGRIVASVMHLSGVTDREDRELGLMLRWSYGSALGSGTVPCVGSFTSPGRAPPSAGR